MGETHRPKLLKCHRKYWTNVVFFLTNILEESNSELLFLPFSNPIHGSGCARLWPKSLVAEWAACFVPFNKMFSSKPYITYCSAAHVVINLCNPIRMSHNVCKDCAKWDCLVCMVQCGWSKVVGAILFPKPVWWKQAAAAAAAAPLVLPLVLSSARGAPRHPGGDKQEVNSSP